LINGLNRVSADVDSLEWLEKSIKNDEKSIAWNMIGLAMDQQKEAMNEMQVAGNFESRQNVLLNVKDNFEKAHSFILNTLAKLRYGSSYIGSTVNYGERFFLHSVLVLQENYKLSKDTGMPVFELANQQQQIMFTKYQNNPEMMERVKILSALEPYQTYTVEELLSIGEQFRLNPLKMAIKINFEDLVNRFEREQMDIVPFMQFSDFQTKINFIQTKLEDYGTEITDTGTSHDGESDEKT